MTKSSDVGQMLKTPEIKRLQTNCELTTVFLCSRLDDRIDMKIMRSEEHDAQSLMQETGLQPLPYFWI